MNQILLIFFQHLDWCGKECLKKTEVELKLLTDADMLLMIEKASELEYAVIHRYVKANREYM